ncbi:MAG: hypothetical protein K1X70_00135 [Leptospirales bacterium]|nr:hypothetical protein [Leptospirales bacterium]HMU84836.1 hypothetical protein [Leptospiraceae bacterium]HNL00802.1 hypothetical protein [Leptospiraceae bacterium]HNN73399.1 hypothetical protein [Leptospiraceae bacterium]
MARVKTIPLPCFRLISVLLLRLRSIKALSVSPLHSAGSELKSYLTSY